MPHIKHYISTGEAISAVVPDCDLSDNILFLLAAHRQWEIEGRGIVTYEFRERLLTRDIDLEQKIRGVDKLVKYARNIGKLTANE